MHHLSKRNCRCFWRILQKTLRLQWKIWLRTWNEWWQKNTWNYDSRATKRNQQTQNRQISRQQWNTCRRHQSLRRRDERNDETTLQRDHKEEQLHTWRVEESEDQSDSQERRRRRCEQLPPDLLITSDVQTVLDNFVWKIIPNAWPTTSRRSGWIQKNLPDNEPPCNIQIGWTEMPGVGNQNVDSDGRLHESFRLHLSQFYLGGTQILQCRSRIRQPPEEILQRLEGASVQTDEESDIFDIQKGSAVLIQGRNTTMAKEKRNGNLLERPRTRLPHELAICRRRDAVRNLQRTAAEYDVRIQESNRESGTQDPPRQDEDSQQPEQHEFRTRKDILKSVKWASKYWQKTKAWNIWAREPRSTNKRHWKSRAGSEQHGRLSTNTDKNWHQKITCSIIDSAFSMAQFVRDFVTLQEHGHRAKNTKEWFNRRNARCYDSSSRRKENTKKLKSKLLSIKIRKELLTRLKIVALMKKAAMVRAQNLKMMWTVEWHLMKTLKRK